MRRRSTNGISATKKSDIVGYLDAVDGSEVLGWACDKAHPTEPLTITAMIDRQVVHSASADLYRPDALVGGSSSPNVGFRFVVPSLFLDGSEHLLEFYDAGNQQLILLSKNGTPSQSWRLSFRQATASTNGESFFSTIIAHIDDITESGISGWAYDEKTPLEPAQLILCIDGEDVAEFVCDRTRADVQNSGHPSLQVGFLRPLPLRYFDDALHRVQLRDRRSRPIRAVTRQNLRMEFRFSPISVRGRVDGLQGGAIRGWAVHYDHATGRIQGGLQILVSMQGHPVAQIVARSSRADVAKVHDCDPNCGFTYYPPARLVAGRSVEFEFRMIPGGHVLTGSPIRVEFPSLETAAAIRDLQEATDKAFAELWLLRDRIRHLAMPETYTVDNYDPWAREYQRALTAAPDRLDGLLPAKARPPTVSIICPAYKPRLSDFEAAVESVRAQSYPHWELIIVDDASRSAQLAKCIAAFKQQDGRVKSVALKQNSGISEATNAGVARAKGRYVAFFDHDDLLEPRAIEFMLAAALRSGAHVLYSDEDKIDDAGMFSEPNFKPDWNYRYLLSINYICHLLMVEREAIRKIGQFRKACDGAQDHDFILRLSEAIPSDRIEHVPEVLYHWRKAPTSTAASGHSKSYAVASGIRAVQDHLDRKALAGQVHSRRGITCFDIDWALSREPAITVIIPYRDHVDMTRECVEKLRAVTNYSNYEIMLVDNWSVSDEAFAFADDMRCLQRLSILRVQEPFNYSRLNNLAVTGSRGELLLFMNNDVFVSQPDWLRVMVGEILADPRAGIVGNKLLYPSGLVQHGGVILGAGGVADHAHKGLAANDPGYIARAICAQDVSAVTAACMLCRRTVFEMVGGFDERELQIAFNDVDLCLKSGRAGYRVIWTPNSVAEHRESFSRGDDMQPNLQARFFHENEVMRERWGVALAEDRYYHRAFSRFSGVFTDLAKASVSEFPALGSV